MTLTKQILQRQREMRKKIKEVTDIIKAEADLDISTMITDYYTTGDTNDYGKINEYSNLRASQAFKSFSTDNKELLSASVCTYRRISFLGGILEKTKLDKIS